MSDLVVDVPKLLRELDIEYRVERNELHALCPAHKDTKPSWSIHAVTGVHHCFSCGFGGGTIRLVQEVLGKDLGGWSARDCVEWLRARGLVQEVSIGFDVELVLRRGPPPKEPIKVPRGVEVGPLASWPTPAIRYLEARRITGLQVRRWGIGYAVDGRLSGRIVFLVRDREHRLLSYSARAWSTANVRYLTPSREENPDEAAVFGEEHWPERGARRRLVVVEGAVKALVVDRVVQAPVAGLLGALRGTNRRILSKVATFAEVDIATDEDAAGEEAASVIETSIGRHVRVRRVRLGGVKIDDAPDELVRSAFG